MILREALGKQPQICHSARGAENAAVIGEVTLPFIRQVNGLGNPMGAAYAAFAGQAGLPVPNHNQKGASQ